MEPLETRETPPGMAGALLRAARESAGMTVDAVAQHLKLAPRQVKAIEDGDFKELPGRTFIRAYHAPKSARSGLIGWPTPAKKSRVKT